MGRFLGGGLVCVLAAGAFAFAVDVTTIRITPDPSSFQIASYAAFPGERLHVELDAGWTQVRSSNPAAVAPIGDNWFVAQLPGSATLSAVTLRCPSCYIVTVLWRARIDVRFPGT